MPDETLPDINFQPKTEGFSYANPNAKNIKKQNTLVTLSLGLFGFLILFVVFLFILNYFNVISLTAYPVLNKLPKLPLEIQTVKPYNIPGTNEYVIDGTLTGFSDKIIKVNFSSKNLDLNYNQSSSLLISFKSKNSKEIATSDFFINLLDKNNLGKKITVQYKEVSGQKVVEIVTLFK